MGKRNLVHGLLIAGLALATLVGGVLAPQSALAATLYISEFPNGVTPVGSLVSTYTPPQPSIADQAVAISGTSAASAAFNTKTHVVALVCDEGCSVSFTGASPTATTSNFLLQQGVTYLFGVSPGAKVAAIENSAGNIGGSTGPNVNLAQVGGVAVALGQTTMAASLPVAIASNQTPVPVSTSDPCSSAAKSSAVISVATATTTSLVAVSGSTKVYVCGFSMSIAPSATAADTAAFEYGTGAACTGPTALTGTYGNGDLTSAAPVVPVSYGGAGQTVFASAASNGICILTTGTAVSVQGVLTYVQQ